MAGMAEKSWRWIKMAGNGLKWLEMARMAGNDWI